MIVVYTRLFLPLNNPPSTNEVSVRAYLHNEEQYSQWPHLIWKLSFYHSPHKIFRTLSIALIPHSGSSCSKEGIFFCGRNSAPPSCRGCSTPNKEISACAVLDCHFNLRCHAPASCEKERGKGRGHGMGKWCHYVECQHIPSLSLESCLAYILLF